MGFLSYDSDYSKPTKAFFDEIALVEYRAHVDANYRSKNYPPGDFLSDCWHVGDSYNNDYIGAVRAGWNGVLLDRNRTSEFSKCKETPE